MSVFPWPVFSSQLQARRSEAALSCLCFDEDQERECHTEVHLGWFLFLGLLTFI